MLQYSFSTLQQFGSVREQLKQDLQALADETAGLVFVAVNEVVNNAILHGECQQVSIAVQKIESRLCVVVRHDGVGFVPTAEAEEADDLFAEHGRGLQIVQCCTDAVEFNCGGNEIVLYKELACE